MTDLAGLLVAADRQAREILLDGPDPGRAKGLLLGWAEAMETAADTLTAIPGHKSSHQQDANVLTQVSRASAAVHMDARRGWPDDKPPDPRALSIAGLLSEAGQRLRDRTSNLSLQATEVSVSVAHTAWLLTHAVANSLTRHADASQRANTADPQAKALMLLVERVRSIEQLLDVQANRYPSQQHGEPSPEAGLAAAMSAWNTTMHAVLDRHPDPRNYAIAADVNLALLARTAALTSTAAQSGTLPADGVRSRLLPALENAAHSWTRTRDQWLSLITPDTTGSRPLMDAAIGLRTILRDPTLAGAPNSPGALASGLAAGVEAAVVSRAGLARLAEAPAVVVAKLTDEMFAAHPDQGFNRFTIWESMARAEGRAHIAIPEPVRDFMLGQADHTVTASIQARSASSILLPTSTYAASVMFAAAHPNPAARREPPPRTITPPPSIGR